MTEGIDTRMLKPDGVQIAFSWFLRGVSIYCLVAGIAYWVRLIGYYPGADWRFDTMPLHWQVATPALSVLFPFAAVGLWMLTSWGPVIWVLCAISEIIMYYFYSPLFGARDEILTVHTIIAGVFLVFAGFMVWRRSASER